MVGMDAPSFRETAREDEGMRMNVKHSIYNGDGYYPLLFPLLMIIEIVSAELWEEELFPSFTLEQALSLSLPFSLISALSRPGTLEFNLTFDCSSQHFICNNGWVGGAGGELGSAYGPAGTRL